MKPEETIDYHIKSTWLKIVKMYNNIASRYGVSQGIGTLLINIDDEGIFVTDLAPRSGIEKTSLARILKSMEEKHLIKRVPDSKDRRKVKVYLTEAGKEKRKIAKKVVRKFNEKILASLSPVEKEIFFNTIDKINGIIEEYKNEGYEES